MNYDAVRKFATSSAKGCASGIAIYGNIRDIFRVSLVNIMTLFYLLIFIFYGLQNPAIFGERCKSCGIYKYVYGFIFGIRLIARIRVYKGI